MFLGPCGAGSNFINKLSLREVGARKVGDKFLGPRGAVSQNVNQFSVRILGYMFLGRCQSQEKVYFRELCITKEQPSDAARGSADLPFFIANAMESQQICLILQT